jgi:hypothetical protein
MGRKGWCLSLTGILGILAGGPTSASEPESGGDLAAALMNRAYGAPGADGVRTWRVPEDIAVPEPQGLPGMMAEVRPLIRRAFRQHSVDSYVIVAAISNPKSTCHSCGVLIDVVSFTRTADHWELTRRANGVTMAGTWGKPPPIRFRRLGPDEYGFEISDTFGGQGGWNTRLTIYHLKSTGPSAVLSAYTASMNSPFALALDETPSDVLVCKGTDYTFTPLATVTNGLYDLGVTIQTGSRSLPAVRGGRSPCELPITGSPDYRSFQSRAVFRGTAYCQKDVPPGITPALPLCER